MAKGKKCPACNFPMFAQYEEDGISIEFDYALHGDCRTRSVELLDELIAATAEDLIDKHQPLFGESYALGAHAGA